MKAQGIAERTPIFTDREKVLLSCLILFKVGINFYFNAVSGFHRDEYLYLAFSDHPAWGYLSTPPFIGVISSGTHPRCPRYPRPGVRPVAWLP